MRSNVGALTCWVKLLGFDFEIQFGSGLENKAADALSRMPIVVHLATLIVPSILEVEVIKQEVLVDPGLNLIISELETDPMS